MSATLVLLAECRDVEVAETAKAPLAFIGAIEVVAASGRLWERFAEVLADLGEIPRRVDDGDRRVSERHQSRVLADRRHADSREEGVEQTAPVDLSAFSAAGSATRC